MNLFLINLSLKEMKTNKYLIPFGRCKKIQCTFEKFDRLVSFVINYLSINSFVKIQKNHSAVSNRFSINPLISRSEKFK